MQEIIYKAKFIISPVSLALLLDDSAGGIARELLWTNQEFPLLIFPPWLSMLIYHVGDEK
jgi:hypothetical protein